MVRSLSVLAFLLAACSSKKSDAPAAGSASGSAAPPSMTNPAHTIKAQWNVIVTDGVCSANEHGNCPPDTPCDPPAPRAIECPAGITDTAVVAQFADGSCVVTSTGAKTPCPLPAGESLPPLAWAVTAQPDGTCRASWTNPATGAKAVTIKCPVADANIVIKRASKDAPCTTEHGGKTLDVPCPTEPKTLTAVQLRGANPLPAERVRVQGFHLASLDAQTAGKATTFVLGAADTKGDAKAAVRCTSKLAFIEIPDGDAVIVEGVPKKTPDGIVLEQCQAWVP